MTDRTVYRPARLMACILRACERQAKGTALYEVRPALPAIASFLSTTTRLD